MDRILANPHAARTQHDNSDLGVRTAPIISTRKGGSLDRHVCRFSALHGDVLLSDRNHWADVAAVEPRTKFGPSELRSAGYRTATYRTQRWRASEVIARRDRISGSNIRLRPSATDYQGRLVRD